MCAFFLVLKKIQETLPIHRENDDQQLARWIEWATPIFGHKRKYLVPLDLQPSHPDCYFIGFGTSPIADDCDFVRLMHEHQCMHVNGHRYARMPFCLPVVTHRHAHTTTHIFVRIFARCTHTHTQNITNYRL